MRQYAVDAFKDSVLHCNQATVCNFATKLQNAGKDVNFLFARNRPHSGDYALDELFEQIANIVSK